MLEEREAAARAVHAAWMAEKQRQGKSHPHMIPWADLSKAVRAFDYATVDAAWPIIYAAGRAELEGALRDTLDLAARWRDASDDVLGRTSSDGSADLDYMQDEMERLSALLPEPAKPPEATP